MKSLHSSRKSVSHREADGKAGEHAPARRCAHHSTLLGTEAVRKQARDKEKSMSSETYTNGVARPFAVTCRINWIAHDTILNKAVRTMGRSD